MQLGTKKCINGENQMIALVQSFISKAKDHHQQDVEGLNNQIITE